MTLLAMFFLTRKYWTNCLHVGISEIRSGLDEAAIKNSVSKVSL